MRLVPFSEVYATRRLIGSEGKAMGKYTSKQLGDACEMLVAAEMTLAGIPTLKVPDNWPHYDLIAQHPESATPLRISVKARTYKKTSGHFVTYKATDQFDWLAIVLLECEGDEKRQIFLVPRHESDRCARKDGPNAKTSEHYYVINEVAKKLLKYKSNFSLSEMPTWQEAAVPASGEDGILT